MMTDGKTVKCPICGRPYKFYSMLAGDQSACPECRRKAEEAMRRGPHRQGTNPTQGGNR
jgi:endogenous inhibitor of DNA gyrase (YacG/DUF329 family)